MSAADHPRACGANLSRQPPAPSVAGSSPRVRGKPGSASRPVVTGRIIPARAGQTGVMTISSMTSPDHPRACGANSDGHRGEWGPDGSSPRVRGKRTSSPRCGIGGRIIPARAGQTRCLVSERQVSPDHPRACGANAVGCPRCRGVRGSSPRVRGKPHGLAIPGVQVRIIPARAGQTSPPIMVYGWPTDHPRACGANYCSARLKSRAHGSSPRVRGKPDRVVRVPDVGRIIPARAGQTMRHRPPNHEHADHPRACGANKAWDGTSAPPDGSSPRVRGKLCDVLGEHARGRIIPARAGQTGACQTSTVAGSDHPRACGANRGGCHHHPHTAGSSPRVRGKLSDGSAHGFPIRIIPARAGQTVPYWCSYSSNPDHPRACGANSFACFALSGVIGSSPRVRGKHVHEHRIAGVRRIIPARAGQTVSSPR